MRVYIYGADGNMGRRYRAILEHLGHEWLGEDLNSNRGELGDADAVIVATPTATHVEILDKILRCGKPILCEKPICKDGEELRSILARAVLAGTTIQMVSQYDCLVSSGFTGETSWDYFKSGNDDLGWDCIQIIDLARGTVKLDDKSPVWLCTINGQKLNLSDMDGAYYQMIRDWLIAPRNDISRIITSHAKVAKWMESNWIRS